MIPEAGGSSPPPRVREDKLYVLARVDLPVGLRTAQVGHALINWVLHYGKPPDNLVVLAVDDEEPLMLLAHDLELTGVRVHLFYEPDLDDEPTALAVGPEGWKRLSSLPLLRA